MDNIKQTLSDVAEKVEEVTGLRPEAAPVAKAPVEAVKAPIEDRSAFNCASCQGLGLKSQDEICPVCHGTGKVS